MHPTSRLIWPSVSLKGSVSRSQTTGEALRRRSSSSDQMTLPVSWA
jgi:hypothetical protein